MSTITSLSARQLRRAAELKEEMESLEGELNRIADSREGGRIRAFLKPRGRVRSAIKRGITALAGSRTARAGGRRIILPAQRLKGQFGSVAKAKIAAAKARLRRINDIEIT